MLLAAALLSGHAVDAANDGRCRIDQEILLGNSLLPRTLAALRDGAPLSVVAIGSSSTQGYGASRPSQAYPAQLSARLKLHFPRSAIHIRNKGIGGDTIDDMVGRFARDVLAEPPDLVIWQTGTNDAINRVPLEHFRVVLAQGLHDLGVHKIDVILMTPQYAPQFTEISGYADYLQTMRDVATAANVALFDRFDSTKLWFGDRRFADSPVLTKDGLHQSDAGYHCIALLLADRLAVLATNR